MNFVPKCTSSFSKAKYLLIYNLSFIKSSIFPRKVKSIPRKFLKLFKSSNILLLPVFSIILPSIQLLNLSFIPSHSSSTFIIFLASRMLKSEIYIFVSESPLSSLTILNLYIPFLSWTYSYLFFRSMLLSKALSKS